MAALGFSLAEPMLFEVSPQSVTYKARAGMLLSLFGCAALLTWPTERIIEEPTSSAATGLWAIGRPGLAMASPSVLQPRMATSATFPLIPRVKYSPVAVQAEGESAGVIPTVPPGFEKLDAVTEKFTVGDGKKGVVALTRYLLAYRNNQRSGQACTKTRGEVSGGGKKPYKQKKTGNARRGSSRSPLIVGGGVIFGPKPRSYYTKLNKKEKRLATQRAIWEAAVSGAMEMVDDFGPQDGKTKNMAAWIDPRRPPGKKHGGFDHNIFLVDDGFDPLVLRAAGNIKRVETVEAWRFNAYDTVLADKIFITKKGLDAILARTGVCEDEDEEEDAAVSDPVPA